MIRLAWPLLAAVVVAALMLPFGIHEQLLTAAITALQLIYLAQCWNIVAGYAGQFSLGHSVFLGIGAYTSTALFLTFGVSPWLGAIAGAALAAVAGVALGALAFRYRVKGVFFAVLTLGSMEVLRGIVPNLDFIGGANGLFIPAADAPYDMLFNDRRPYYWIALAMVVFMTVLTALMERSKFGQYLLAIREDEDAAEASGVNAFRSKLMAVALSAALTAFGGTFYAQFMLYIAPDTTFVFEHQLNMMLGTMVGGTGTVAGPIVGSAVFSIIAEALRHLPLGESIRIEPISQIIYACILMSMMLVLPGGLVSLVRRNRRLSAMAVQGDTG
jgi:branched-chain amino acid transport system permease protein